MMDNISVSFIISVKGVTAISVCFLLCEWDGDTAISVCFILCEGDGDTAISVCLILCEEEWCYCYLCLFHSL